MTQLKIQLYTCLLIAASLASILPIVNSQSGTITNANTETESFPGVKDDIYMHTGVENDIYAVGGDGNVWHWNGAWWWQVTSGRAVEIRIQVVSQDEIYGLSRNPTGHLNVYKWNGIDWTAVTWDGSLLDSFQVVSETQIYAIGEDHQVYLWNGTSWNGCTCSIEGVSDQIQVINQQIYSVNQLNQVVKWNGTEWETITDQTPINDYFSLKSEKEIYSIDQTGNIIFWNGESWHPLTSGFSATRRLFYVSSSEIFTLGTDGMIWQWNGNQAVKITTKITNTDNVVLDTYYRVKYIEGNLSLPPAMIAYKDRLVIASVGITGGIYIREWTPSRLESWDTARNSQNLGADNWYALDGCTFKTPQLKVEDGTLSLYVMGTQNIIYKRDYIKPNMWSSVWEQVYGYNFVSGPYSSAGFGIAPTSSKGYPSPVAIVKYTSFSLPKNQTANLDQLVIYELTTKEFTSPNGPGTGTFASATEKLGNLKEVGINAIWLSGVSWSDPRHFSNTSTQYATIHPELLDPSLGSDPTNISKTDAELKTFINTAHSMNIKVFFDVVTHGVMSYSPLVNKNGIIPSYVSKYPDELNITAHPDWFGSYTWPALSDYPVNKGTFPQNTRMIDYVGGYQQTDLDQWWVEIWTSIVIKYKVDGLRIDLGSSRFDLWAQIKENAILAGQELIIMPEGEPQSYPFETGIYQFEQVDYAWTVFAKTSFNETRPSYGSYIKDMKIATEELFPNLDRQYNIVPISCHDSPSYTLDGSRFKLGYGAIFTPFIPLFMAGEEFNNPYTPVPNSTAPWLLSSQVVWDYLQDPQNKLFYDDMKKAIEIRKNEPALNYFSPNITNPNVVLVDALSSSISNSPTPYIRYLPNGSQAILITGNNNSDPVIFSMQLPLNETNLEGYQYYDVVNLWNNTSTIMSSQDIADFTITVEADDFSIIKITPHVGPVPWTFYWPIIAALSALIVCSFIIPALLIRSHKITFIRRR